MVKTAPGDILLGGVFKLPSATYEAASMWKNVACVPGGVFV